MTPDEKLFYSALLKDAEIAYKLALAVDASCHSSSGSQMVYPALLLSEDKAAGENELRLEEEEEKRASTVLVHYALYIMAIQLDTALSVVVPDRFNHGDSDICSASWIARMIRNAFAHNPLYPVWLTYPECDNRTFRVKDIISLDTSGRNGKHLRRGDFGGQLSLFRLSEFVRTTLLQ